MNKRYSSAAYFLGAAIALLLVPAMLVGFVWGGIREAFVIGTEAFKGIDAALGRNAQRKDGVL